MIAPKDVELVSVRKLAPEGVICESDWKVLTQHPPDWRVLSESDWRVLGESDWRVLGESDWRVLGESDWRVLGESDWRMLG